MTKVDLDKKSTKRLFFALWPDDQVRGKIAVHARQWAFPEVSKLYAPADWHVTLHFIGNVPADRVPEIADCADVHLDPFELVLDRPEVWPRGLAVLCASDVPSALVGLHARLGGVLRGMNIAIETRQHRPHLTLARHAKGAVPPTTSAPIVWPVRSFALVVSTGDAGARYEVLRAYESEDGSTPYTGASRQ